MLDKQYTNTKEEEVEEKQCTNCFCPVSSLSLLFIDTVGSYTHSWDFHLVDHFECKSLHEPRRKRIEEMRG